MSKELRQRLEALSTKATQDEWTFGVLDEHGPWAVGNKRCFPLLEACAAPGAHNEFNAKLAADLVNAFRSGHLVTRTEMEEAVAKAVAEEREAIQTEIIDVYAGGALYPPIGWPAEEKEHWRTGGLEHLTAVTSAIRARSEQKEGE